MTDSGALFYIVDGDGFFWTGNYWSSVQMFAKQYDVTTAFAVFEKRWQYSGRRGIRPVNCENYKKRRPTVARDSVHFGLTRL